MVVYATTTIRSFMHATYSFTGNKKPGGVTPSAPLAFRKQETDPMDL